MIEVENISDIWWMGKFFKFRKGEGGQGCQGPNLSNGQLCADIWVIFFLPGEVGINIQHNIWKMVKVFTYFPLDGFTFSYIVNRDGSERKILSLYDNNQ